MRGQVVSIKRVVLNSKIKLLLVLILAGIIISGCIQPRMASKNVTEQKVTKTWTPDGVISDGEYSRNMTMTEVGGSGRSFEVCWKNDAQDLYMAMKAKTLGWIAVGYEPTDWMKDADIVLGYVHDGNAIVQDQYSTGNYGPHVPDTELGGTNDIQEYGGRAENGYTVIEFKRKMNTGDKYDKAFVPGQAVPIIWSLSDSNSTEVRHVADGKGVMNL